MKKDIPTHKKSHENLEKRRKQAEATATFGLILIAVALVAPFSDIENVSMLSIFKWIYAPGALIFTVARILGVGDPEESLRLRRLRRLECWAGIAFCIAAFFWFYNDYHYIGSLPNAILTVGPLKVLNETIMFSLVGAMIQLISSWMITWRQRKESKQSARNDDSQK